METQSGVNLDELQSTAERLLSLLRDRQPGLTSWHVLVGARMNELRAMTSQALDETTKSPLRLTSTATHNVPGRGTIKTIANPGGDLWKKIRASAGQLIEIDDETFDLRAIEAAVPAMSIGKPDAMAHCKEWGLVVRPALGRASPLPALAFTAKTIKKRLDGTCCAQDMDPQLYDDICALLPNVIAALGSPRDVPEWRPLRVLGSIPEDKRRCLHLAIRRDNNRPELGVIEWQGTRGLVWVDDENGELPRWATHCRFVDSEGVPIPWSEVGL